MILPEDCIKEILEHLAEDKKSLYKCLFANRLFCKCVVPILWRDPWSEYFSRESFWTRDPWSEYFSRTNYWTILGKTIIKCFPREIKQSLSKKIFLNPSLLQQPLFIYVSYIQSISESAIDTLNENVFEDYGRRYFQLLKDEFWSLFMKQCFKIKFLCLPTMNLFKYPGSRNFLSSLSTLECYPNTSPAIFIELSKNVHTLKRLVISVNHHNLKYIETLILSQKNLEELSFSSYKYPFPFRTFRKIIYGSGKYPILFKNQNTIGRLSQSLRVLEFYRQICLPSQNISSFINLTELSINYSSAPPLNEENDKILEHVSLPKLEILTLKNVNRNNLDIYAKLIDNTRNSLKVIDIYFNEDNPMLSLESIEYYLNVIKTKCPDIEILPIWLIPEIPLSILECLLESCSKVKKIIIYILNSNSLLDTVLAKPILYLLALKSSMMLNDIRLIGRWSFSNLDIQEFFELWKGMKRTPLKFKFDNNIFSQYIIKICEFYHRQGIINRGIINYTTPYKYC
ncbi:7466_t:CDS:1 [Funneliformis geosporum]|uniref:16918_t:CDS:1 n=1 Tax=Funneliformis geosporum TaxID=1117311 RepID=A0A9W4WIA2_9GLOM|nr:16918_t:CDS:1 [Funneliformis geosporum]CAI2167779.1 7466_t:CDS:1 [Funneliformis geosporum]